MLSRWERWVFFYDFVLESAPDDAPQIQLRDVIDVLIPRFRGGECVKLINRETAALRIQDMILDEQREYVAMLINYSDSEATDPVFGDLETGVLRLEPKLEGEGVTTSAHLIVSLRPTRTGSFQAVLEDVPGIGRTKLVPFLTSEFRAIGDFRFRDVNGREKRCRPVPRLLGHQSQTLREDLGRGVLSAIELESRRAPAEMDELPDVEVTHRRISFKPTRPSAGETALGIVNRIARVGRERGYEEIRVKFNRNEGKQRTVPAGTLREDVGDVLYARLERISGFEEPLEQAYEAARPDVLERMLTLLDGVRPVPDEAI